MGQKEVNEDGERLLRLPDAGKRRLRPKKRYQQGTTCMCQLLQSPVSRLSPDGFSVVFHSCEWQKFASRC